MTVQCPTISDTLVFADDAQLAAKLSCILARPRSYLPVIDGPRLQRQDRDHEVIRRGNAAARSKAERFVFAGLAPDSVGALGTVMGLPSAAYIDSAREDAIGQSHRAI
jgi:hypothetical protein